MPYFQFLWLPEYEERVTAHGASVLEFERIVQDPEWTETSRSSIPSQQNFRVSRLGDSPGSHDENHGYRQNG